MRAKCLVLDHDDTVVNSTATVHWPCFAEYMAKYHPDKPRIGLEEYFRLNFDPGVAVLFRDIAGITGDEVAFEQAYWHAYVQEHVPEAYPGIRELLAEQKRQGGLIAVVSHSLSPNILRDYRVNALPEPDAVYGWECPPDRRKPSPWALRDIMERFSLAPEELLVVDDLKPGFDMARAAGVPFAAARWSNDIDAIDRVLRGSTKAFFKTVRELYTYQFENDKEAANG